MVLLNLEFFFGILRLTRLMVLIMVEYEMARGPKAFTSFL
jgi:hypothetical protein